MEQESSEVKFININIEPFSRTTSLNQIHFHTTAELTTSYVEVTTSREVAIGPCAFAGSDEVWVRTNGEWLVQSRMRPTRQERLRRR